MDPFLSLSLSDVEVINVRIWVAVCFCTTDFREANDGAEIETAENIWKKKMFSDHNFQRILS